MNAAPTHDERLRSNYNEVGVAVMQAMYSDDYLSIGGIESTNELARLANIDSTTRVLDVGCGVGGPMLQLAESIGCVVTGIDLIQSNVEQAIRRASARNLSALASFRQADATNLPFEDATFDVVWGQDAWCHVADKPAMLAEAKRVLRPGGTIAFTDWLAGDGMSPVERQAALDAALSSTAISADGYQAMLAAAGFAGLEHCDISATFVRQYQEICAGLKTNRVALEAQFSERVYEIVSELNSEILGGFEGGAIAGGRFIGSTSDER